MDIFFEAEARLQNSNIVREAAKIDTMGLFEYELQESLMESDAILRFINENTLYQETTSYVTEAILSQETKEKLKKKLSDFGKIFKPIVKFIKFVVKKIRALFTKDKGFNEKVKTLRALNAKQPGPSQAKPDSGSNFRGGMNVQPRAGGSTSYTGTSKAQPVSNDQKAQNARRDAQVKAAQAHYDTNNPNRYKRPDHTTKKPEDHSGPTKVEVNEAKFRWFNVTDKDRKAAVNAVPMESIMDVNAIAGREGWKLDEVVDKYLEHLKIPSKYRKGSTANGGRYSCTVSAVKAYVKSLYFNKDVNKYDSVEPEEYYEREMDQKKVDDMCIQFLECASFIRNRFAIEDWASRLEDESVDIYDDIIKQAKYANGDYNDYSRDAESRARETAKLSMLYHIANTMASIVKSIASSYAEACLMEYKTNKQALAQLMRWFDIVTDEDVGIDPYKRPTD